MRKNKMLSLLLALLLIVSLCSCGGSGQGGTTEPAKVAETTKEPAAETTTTEKATETTTKPTTATEPATAAPPETATDPATEPAKASPPVVSGSLSDDLYSFETQINGVVYKLPTPFANFEANGWAAKSDLDETLKPSSYTGETIRDGDQPIYASILNLDVNVLPIKDCYVFRVKLDEFDVKKGTQMVLPGGITHGTPMDDVIAAYGDPSDTYEGDTRIALTYRQQSYAKAEIVIDPETKLVKSLQIENGYAPDDFVAGTPAGAGETPDEVSKYKAPSDLGQDYKSFNIKFADDMYTLPAPVSSFIENGWTVIDSGVTVPARSSSISFAMSKNNQTLKAALYNYSDSLQPAENCFVTTIKSSEFGPKLPLELPGGVSMESSYDDIVKAYGEPDKVDDSTTFNFYTYGKTSEQISFSIKKETGEISTIEVSHRPKELGY